MYTYVRISIYDIYMYIPLIRQSVGSASFVAVAAHIQHTAAHCNTLRHTATYCNILQHPATHAAKSNDSWPRQVLWQLPHVCNTLQHSATYYEILQHSATLCNTHRKIKRSMGSARLSAVASHIQHTATHCNTLQHTVTHYNILQRSATHTATSNDQWARHVCRQLLHIYKTLQHSATLCNTLQHTATYCNTHRKTKRSVGSARFSAVASHIQHTETHCNTLQHTATHCNILQHTPQNQTIRGLGTFVGSCFSNDSQQSPVLGVHIVIIQRRLRSIHYLYIIYMNTWNPNIWSLLTTVSGYIDVCMFIYYVSNRLCSASTLS